MMPNEHKKIYVFGDAGTDRFIGEKVLGGLPSGAPLAHCLLEAVLPDHFEIKSLVHSAKDGSTPDQGLRLSPLEQKDAELERYDNILRIKSYNISDTPDPSAPAQYYLCSNLRPTSDDLLVAHHAGSEWSSNVLDKCIEWIHALTPPERAPHFPHILVNLSSKLPKVQRLTSQSAKEALDAGDIAISQDGGPFESKLWNELYKVRHHVGIVTNMTTLRTEGAVISRRLSFEHTVEDFCSELHRLPSLNFLAHFSHLFIRIGMVGVVHIKHLRDDVFHRKFRGEFYFSPYAKHGLHRNEEDDGYTLGRNTLLIAALALGWAAQTTAGNTKEIINKAFAKRASELALRAMRRMDDKGYCINDDCDAKQMIAQSAGPAKKVFAQWEKTQTGDQPTPGEAELQDVHSWRRIPAHLLTPMPPRAATTTEPWHILDDVLLDAPVHRINIALAIVMSGHQNVLNRKWHQKSAPNYEGITRNIWNWLTRKEYWNPHDRAPDFVTLQEGYEPAMPWRTVDKTTLLEPIEVLGKLDDPFWLDVPVMAFGKLNLLERAEIESLRSIANLVRLHRKQAEKTQKVKEIHKPISIAVFGPPGTGKSFAVKQLPENIGDKDLMPLMEFNVAQFSGPEDLNKALAEVAKVSAPKKPMTPADSQPLTVQPGSTDGNKRKIVTPLVFFDEFDCALNDGDLGWLKYFLAPMQDGKYAIEGKDQKEDIGPAIFVFAGGLHTNFSSFDPRTDSAYDNLRDLEEYQQRLKRFIGQKGPDFISRLRGHINILPINDDPGRPKHFIRRAMQLRNILDTNGFVPKTGPKKDEAKIHTAIVYALLTTDRFRHGVRSIQAIVEMCTPIHGRVEIASLPSRAQLDMHVDATEFMIRVHRGRERDLNSATYSK